MNTYYKTSADYHDALDKMEARERAERAEAEYTKRLDNARAAVKEILNDDANYISLIMRVKDCELLDVLETIIAQCAEWDKQELTRSEVMAEIIEGKRQADVALYEMRTLAHKLTDQNHIAYDDGCGNDADLYDYARGG